MATGNGDRENAYGAIQPGAVDYHAKPIDGLYCGPWRWANARASKPRIWIPTTDLPVSPGHPFYARLNAILDEAGAGAGVR